MALISQSRLVSAINAFYAFYAFYALQSGGLLVVVGQCKLEIAASEEWAERNKSAQRAIRDRSVRPAAQDPTPSGRAASRIGERRIAGQDSGQIQVSPNAIRRYSRVPLCATLGERTRGIHNVHKICSVIFSGIRTKGKFRRKVILPTSLRYDGIKGVQKFR